MPIHNRSHLKFDHDEYARTRPSDDFWGQVRRTVKGKPVPDEQINMIIEAIGSALGLQPEDRLLDMACGNGALAARLFGSCCAYFGIDFSEHLISVAKKNFEIQPRYQFKHQEVLEYVRTEADPGRFSKAVCYGSFSYFPAATASEVLHTLHEKFVGVQAIFIGNLPDKELASAFYPTPPDTKELSDAESQIGIWRSRDEFTALATDAGWNVKILGMPAGFYASHYRYDALLSRRSS